MRQDQSGKIKIKKLKNRQSGRSVTPVLVLIAAFFIAIGAVVWYALTVTYDKKNLVIYHLDTERTLAYKASQDAKIWRQTSYRVGEFSNDEVTFKLALIPNPIKDRWMVIPLDSPCTEEQANLKDGDIVYFDHSNQSLDPNQPNSANILCYLAIKH